MCGCYATNIQRYLLYFDRKQFEVVELEELIQTPAVALQRLARLMPLPTDAVERWVADQASGKPVHMNEAARLDERLEPDETALRHIASCYVKRNEELGELVGRDLGWHRTKHYRILTRKGTEFIRTESFKMLPRAGDSNSLAPRSGTRRLSEPQYTQLLHSSGTCTT
eukprot:4865156-Pyramimonas_sp.AAC.1